MDVTIRKATNADAAGISAIWEIIVAERKFSAVRRAWSADEQVAYLNRLSAREATFVADAGDRIVAFQTLDRWVIYPSFMDHVGQLGTFVLPEWRGQRVGQRLAHAMFAFTRSHEYQKLVIWVRESNTAAQQFYARLGFRECGRLSRQLMINDSYDGEVLMERFL